MPLPSLATKPTQVRDGILVTETARAGAWLSRQNVDYVAVALPGRIGADIGAEGLDILSCSISRSLKVSRLIFGFHDGPAAPVAVAANGLGGGTP